MTMPRRLVPVDEARYLLGGIGRTSLWELERSGKIQKVKLGRRAFFTEESINLFIEGLIDG